MNKETCQTIQSELDLLMLGERPSAEVTVHLNECSVCRDFQAKQTKLREIVGSLGTVSAPADFDFRLRARLANEQPAASLSPGISWLLGPKAVAVGSALALIFATVVFIGYKSTSTQQAEIQPNRIDSVAVGPSPSTGNEANNNPGAETVKLSSEESNDEKAERSPAKNNRNQRVVKRPSATVEFSSTGVESIKPSANIEVTDAVFSIEASQQPYRVSLYDGRGKARTISVPPVSFGSQRAIPTSNQFAPKGIW